jgi:hypothetical protein
MDTAIDELVDEAGCARRRACDLVARAPASHYRAKQPPRAKTGVAKRAQEQSRALSESENEVISDTFHKHDVNRGQLTLHVDRGSSMASKPVAFLLADLGVTKTHSRPHVPNDNPPPFFRFAKSGRYPQSNLSSRR